MKIGLFMLVTISALLFSGCASDKAADSSVRTGMSRSDLIQNFGEPLRMEHLDDGAENWFYLFAAWKSHPTSDSGTINDFGERTTYGSVGMEFSKEREELPIHISTEGYVVRPLPPGKIVKK